MPKPLVCVRVRQLVEFALRRGDLGGTRDFVGSDRALAGIRGHQRLQRSRPAGYQKEIRLAHDIVEESFVLRVQGRIDGLILSESGVLIEEIKTTQGRWNGDADPLHWAQAKIYGFIYAHDHACKRIALRLAYLDLETDKVSEFLERFSFGELSAFFEAAIGVYLDWVRDQQRWLSIRDQSIRQLAFPFERYRPGQRKIAVAVYRAIAAQRRLFIEAPTGIGKTISVIFPALKAMAEGKFERLFYLTARTTARAIAEKAFSDLRKGGLRARTLTLTAKEKICLREGQPCDPALCPLARGYYDRRQPAMRAALALEEITRTSVEQVAERHQVCPFELSLDVSMWVDAVICDYNYVFDPKVYLRRHFGDENGAAVLLVDEAHNLVDRARAMFSAEITTSELLEVRKSLEHAAPACGKALRKLGAAIRKIGRAAPTDDSTATLEAASDLDLFNPAVPALANDSPRMSIEDPRTGGGVLSMIDFPPALLPPLQEAVRQAEKWLLRNEAAEFRPDVLALYFHLSFFLRTADRYDECYRTLLLPGRDTRLKLFCLDPSLLLNETLTRCQAAVLFSATLNPVNYYRDLLGGSAEDPLLQLPSPFPPEHLAVLVQDRIRTQFKSRQTTLNEVAEAIGALVRERRGNYMVYLPSYHYLEIVREQFERLCPNIAVLVQRPGMTDSERESFLEAFAADNSATQVGFAVMGGVFGEGVDLVGDRLIGAVVVGVGLPQICDERDLMRDYFQMKAGAGFDYAYTFPGINRVLQATGRRHSLRNRSRGRNADRHPLR